MIDFWIEGLSPVLDLVAEAFAALGIDFYMVGALAKDAWFIERELSTRSTKDIDFAILVTGQDQFREVKDYLIRHYFFEEIKDNPFRLKTSQEYFIDIIPFGGLSLEAVSRLDGVGLTSISTEGFSIVHEMGTILKAFPTGHTFKIASLPSIIMLKLISYDDVPERRIKDPGDIAMILHNYWEIQDAFITDNYREVFITMEARGYSLQVISAYVIGCEVRKMTINNPDLHGHIIKILNKHLVQEDRSYFFREMVSTLAREGKKVNLQTILNWITALQKGLEGTRIE